MKTKPRMPAFCSGCTKFWSLRLLAAACLLALPGLRQLSGAEPAPLQRRFIAHRGVNLHFTIAGENSLEAVRCTQRAGFEAIETDVRRTADGRLVVMHDDTLNRTCLNADGTELRDPVSVAGKTLRELKAKYILKASEQRNRTPIPTLGEFLAECKRCSLLPFLHPKLDDETGEFYRDIIRQADEVMGAGNYVVTSNNRANLIIRRMGLKEVPLMGILYQTTFEEIAGLGRVIMAISSSRFPPDEFASCVARAASARIPIESSADDYAHFSTINGVRAVNYVSTDFLAPDLKPNTPLLRDCARFDDFSTAGRREGDLLRLPAGGTLSLKDPWPAVHFGGIYLELEMRGACDVRLGNQDFSIINHGMQWSRHQLMLYRATPGFKVSARGACEIRSIRLRLAAF